MVEVNQKENNDVIVNNELDDSGFKKLKAKDPKKKRHFKMFSAFTILLAIIAVLVLVSWILNWAGVSTLVGDVKETIKPMGILDIFVAPIKGFINRAEIIIFILVLGAFIQLVIGTKSLEGFSQGIVGKLKGKEIWAIIPLMIFFAICGTAEGMAEESLGFYLICIPLMIAAGFDTFTGLMIVLVGAGAGVLASTVNPFVVTIAVDGVNNSFEKMKVLNVGDGLAWRFITWFAFVAGAITFVMLYAKKVKLNPQKSIVFATMEGDKAFFLANASEKVKMTWRRKATLIVFGLTFIIMIMYMVAWDQIFQNTAMKDAGEWMNNHLPHITALIPGFGIGYLGDVAAMFLISGIIIGVINGMGEEKFLKEFMTGATDIISVCLIIAVAGGVGVILENSHLQELMVNGLATSVGSMKSEIGIVLVLFIIFLPLSFLIPSTSGFAAAIFPLLSGVLVTQTGNGVVAKEYAASGAIAAFSHASGIINLITPTSGVVMGAIAIARIPYDKFLKGMLPLVAGATVLSVIMLAAGGGVAALSPNLA